MQTTQTVDKVRGYDLGASVNCFDSHKNQLLFCFLLHIFGEQPTSRLNTVMK